MNALQLLGLNYSSICDFKKPKLYYVSQYYEIGKYKRNFDIFLNTTIDYTF